MDTISSDGNCGLTLKAGVQGVEKAIKVGTITGTDLVTDVVAIAKVADTEMGGMSSVLYSISSPHSHRASSPLQPTLVPPPRRQSCGAPYTLWCSRSCTRMARTLVDLLAAFVDASLPVTLTPLAPPATAAKKEALSPASAPQHADFLAARQHMCAAVVAAEPEITGMDMITGNGDCVLEF
ncbi:hypothetical protein B0H14DRAFT_3872434 [Mycena olivaceomarginata]|nr:hypothetical protein B0H14DRAFT_3872434 [Mycena olivaceomarginata]